MSFSSTQLKKLGRLTASIIWSTMFIHFCIWQSKQRFMVISIAVVHLNLRTTYKSLKNGQAKEESVGRNCCALRRIRKFFIKTKFRHVEEAPHKQWGDNRAPESQILEPAG